MFIWFCCVIWSNIKCSIVSLKLLREHWYYWVLLVYKLWYWFIILLIIQLNLKFLLEFLVRIWQLLSLELVCWKWYSSVLRYWFRRYRMLKKRNWLLIKIKIIKSIYNSITTKKKKKILLNLNKISMLTHQVFKNNNNSRK